MSYARFAAMIATSTIVMYGLMYLNTFLPEHVFWSETRVWMAVLMGAVMAVIMLGYMGAMYKDRRINLAIYAGSVLVFAVSLWLVRSQATVDDIDYMKAMIPHHSIAIMTSTRAQISDPRVRKLADEIIEAQQREISEMKYLVDDLQAREQNGMPDEKLDAIRPPETAAAATAEQTLANLYLPTLDPARLNDTEIGKLLGESSYCKFSYTSESPPVLAVSAAKAETGIKAVVKLNGKLVPLSGTQSEGEIQLRAGAVHLMLMLSGPGPDLAASGPHPADLVFKIPGALTASYDGYFTCSAPAG